MSKRISMIAVLLMVNLPAVVAADEVDDLLSKRHGNAGKVKRLKAEVSVETERPAYKDKLARKLNMRYGFTFRLRDKRNPDPLKRYDAEIGMLEPHKMRIRIENGEFSFLAESGAWIKRDLPDSAKSFFNQLPDRQADDPASERKVFDIKRNKDNDNLLGTRIGFTFVPKGPARLYARREEIVDAKTGQAVVTELYDGKGKLAKRTEVKRYGKHNGVPIPEDVETETYGEIGKIVQHSKWTNVEVDIE
jgi:hypothetical protein